MNLQNMVDSATIFIDVRNEDEYAAGHLEGAINIPLSDIPSRKQEIKDLGEKTVIFYCRSGNRSGSAVAHLQQLVDVAHFASVVNYVF